jgi:hypothetical protein
LPGKASSSGETTPSHESKDTLLIPERAERGLAVLEELLSAFPLDNPQVRTTGSPVTECY